MASSWIEHVKAYAKKNNMKYNEALKKAGPSYKKKARGSTEKTTKKGNKRKGKMPGSRLAFDDTKQEKEKMAKKKK